MVGGIRINDSDLSNLLTMNQIRMVSSQLISNSIVSNDEQITTEAGDIVLYAGDRIVIFYGSNSWAYTKLGHIDQAQEEMEKLLGQEDVEIQLGWEE